MDPSSEKCIRLARGAWLAAAAWFVLASFGGWAFTPGGFLGWSLPALPLAVLTLGWLRRVGQGPPRRAVAWVAGAWAGLLALLAYLATSAADIPDSRLALALGLAIYAAFPLWLTTWALRAARRVGE